MGFSTLGKPTKANVINDNSVKALHRTAASLEETDQWVGGIEQAQQMAQAQLEAVAEKVAQGDQQLAKEVSLVHQRIDEQAQALSEMDQGVSAAFDQVTAGHQDVIKYVLDLEKKIYLAQDNVQELSQYLDDVKEVIKRQPSPPSQRPLWYAVGVVGASMAAIIVYLVAGA